MTETLEKAVEKARSLSAQRQDEIGEILWNVISQDDAPNLTGEQIADVRAAITEADAGDLVGKAEIDKVFARHGT